MVHHEGVIIEDCRSVDFVDSDKVPDNVGEQVMRAPHLDQVLCLLGSQSLPFTKINNINRLKVYNNVKILLDVSNLSYGWGNSWQTKSETKRLNNLTGDAAIGEVQD